MPPKRPKSANTRGKQRQDPVEEEDVSMGEEPLDRPQAKSSKQQVQKSLSKNGRKRAITNADEGSGGPSKKARATDAKDVTAKVSKSDKSKSSLGARGAVPEKGSKPKARRFTAPEDIDVDGSDSSERDPPKKRPQPKDKLGEEIDVVESDNEDSSLEGRSGDSEVEDDDDGKRNDYEIPVWDGRKSKQIPATHSDSGRESDVEVSKPSRKDPRSKPHNTKVSAADLFDRDEGVEVVDRKPAKLRRKGKGQPLGNRERKLKAEQPDWGQDESLSSPEPASRPRGSVSKPKKSAHKAKVKTRVLSSEPDSSDGGDGPEPWKIVYNGSRVPILRQSPLIKSILQTAWNAIVRSALMENFYPLPQELDKRCRKELFNAASRSELDHSEKVANFIKTNGKYGDDLITVIRSKFGALRCDVRDYARSCVPGHYQLANDLDCSATIKQLKDEDIFIYAAADNEVGYDASKPYQHAAVIAVVRWFVQDRQSVGTAFLPEFRSSMPEGSVHQEAEVPAPLLAFASTMVYAELDDWKSGRYKKSPFRADTFASLYQSFIEDLTSLRESQTRRYHRLTSTILQSVRQGCHTPTAPQSGVSSRRLRRALALPDIEGDD